MNSLNKILTKRTIYIFLLISLPMSIQSYVAGQDLQNLLFILLNLFGFILYLNWIVAIGIKGSKIVKSKGIKLNLIKPFYVVFVLSILFHLFFTFVHMGEWTLDSNDMDITIQRPVGLFFLYIFTIIYLKVIIARIIVAVEKNKIPNIEEYVKTLILLLIPYYGILFVHYRVKEKIGGYKSA